MTAHHPGGAPQDGLAAGLLRVAETMNPALRGMSPRFRSELSEQMVRAGNKASGLSDHKIIEQAAMHRGYYSSLMSDRLTTADDVASPPPAPPAAASAFDVDRDWLR